jgi:hypothetical protein
MNERTIRKILAPIFAVAFLSGCARIGPPTPPSLELPKAVTDLRAVRKGDKVLLSWTDPTRTTVAETVRRPGPTHICRSLKADPKQCTMIGQVTPGPVGKGASKGAPRAEYTDTLPTTQAVDYTGQYTYAVEAMNTYGRSAGLSNRVHVAAAPALAPPSGFHLSLSALGVEISWMCPPAPSSLPPDVRYQLRVYRSEEGSMATTQVAEADPFNCQRPLLDQSFEWEKTYLYHADVATIVTVSGKPEIQVEGDDTPQVQIVTHDVFPPATPSGLQAVFSGVGQAPAIDLSWDPDTEADLAGYYIYRREDGGRAVKLNSEPARTSAYRDDQVQSGKKYFYSVTAVDVRSNESPHSEEANEAVP